MKTQTANFTQLLADKINAYKIYSESVKQRVLKQLENRQVTEKEFNQVIKKLPSVMAANNAFLIKFNRALKDAHFLERHAYAPELNTLHTYSGKTFKTPGKTTIPDAINYLLGQ